LAVRVSSPDLERCLGEGSTVVVVNRPGAGGVVGFIELASSEPDGYMIANLNAPNIAVNAITGSSYTLEDFEILGNIVGTSVTLAVDKDSDIQSLEDLVDAARNASQPLNLGMASIAADDHLMALRFARLADVDFNYVPLESAPNVRNSILGGHLVVGSISNTETAPFLEELTVLAVASAERLDTLPDVPTFRELGYDLVAGSNHIIGTKAGVPEAIRDKLAGCIDQVGNDPVFLAEATERQISLNVMNAEEAQAFVAAEFAELQDIWEVSPWQ
jgi:tripartite-type tricarboxylate transporter receptor subunit TctC